MSVELVNRIAIKKDGIFISSHSNNDTSPFYSHKLEDLSRDWINACKSGSNGRKKIVAAELFFMFSYYGPARTAQNHPSVLEIERALEKEYFLDSADIVKQNELECGILELIKKSGVYRESEISEKYGNNTLETKFERAFHEIRINRAFEYYLKNGGAERWGIEI